MTQPPPYNRLASFSNLQALNPSGQPPGNTMDAEYNAIKTTLDATLANLTLLQNDDGTVRNQSIGPAQLSSQLTLGFTAPSVWKTATAYTASPTSTVLQTSSLYICLVSHTSGVFATDLANGKWLLVLNLAAIPVVTAGQVGVTPDGGLVSSDVQTSLVALDTGKAATSHTHTSTAISDSTVVGRQMLTAANTAAQQALLGLGSVAYLNTVPAPTAIPAQLAFTGSVTVAALATNNDLVPTGWATVSVARLTSGADFQVTGFGATTDGDIKFIQNVSTSNLVLVGNSPSSAAANRIALSSPLVLGPGTSCVLQYDGTSARWRLLGPVVVTPLVQGFVNLRVGNVANYLGDSAPGTPNNQLYVKADGLILQDTVTGFAATWRVTPVTVAIDGTAQNQANGTDGAYAIGASNWYSIWVIGNPTTQTIAGLISTSATAPTMPSGYTFRARVGWMRTDGSAHFLKTLQFGRTARYVQNTTLPSMATSTSTPSVTTFVPPTAIKIAVVLQAAASTTGSSAVAPNATSTNAPLVLVANANGTGNMLGEFNLEGSTLSYTTNQAGASLLCYGWEDGL